MALWNCAHLTVATLCCIFAALGWGVYIVGFALRINDKVYSVEDVYRCSGGGGTGLEGIEPKDRQMFHFANYFFFSWWGAVVAGPITIVVLIINQILVIFHRRVCMVSIFIFLTLFATIFFAAVCGDILHADAMEFYCSNNAGSGGHIRYATEYYFVTLEFAGVAVAIFFVGLAVFFQFLLALCRFKSDTGYDTHCAGALCSGGCMGDQEENN